MVRVRAPCIMKASAECSRAGTETTPAMPNDLPIDLDNLIHARSVEDNRREFKAVWSESTANSTVRSICAFANDLMNLNGGYVIIGIEESGWRPILPPRGLDDADLDKIQIEIHGQCNRIVPSYQPSLFPVLYDGKPLLVIWAPAGDNKPYQAPKRGGERAYYARQGSETVEATGALRTQLFEQAARIPFDDRRSLSAADMSAVSERLVKEFLTDVGSDLARGDGFDRERVYANMRLTYRMNGYNVPRNFALLFFSEDPDEIFSGARIEIAQFADDAGGDLIEERIIRGPLHHQVRRALAYLESLSDVLLEKVPGRAETDKAVSYPHEAMREAVVNAVYHRSYEDAEPTKIYLYPNRMEITSYPGPVQGVEPRHFEAGAAVPAVPARNRKIGETLKELRLAEARGTGLPKIRRRMSENGSPEPRFDFAPSYFRAVLPAHPRYIAIHALRESALSWATGNRPRAVERLQRAAAESPGSGAVAGQIIEYAAAMDDMALAREAFDRFQAAADKTESAQPYLRYAEAMLNRGKLVEFRNALRLMPPASGVGDMVESAILSKRAGNYEEAHRIFESAYSQTSGDARTAHEFAQTKIALARAILSRRDPAKLALNRQAAELLRRAIQLTDDPTRKAWIWFDLARTLSWLRQPKTEVQDAFEQAIRLRPEETRFSNGYNQWRKRARVG